jgi:hypothetical protein
MRVNVHDLIGPYATTSEHGERVYEVIAPAINAGEPVELDFEEVEQVTSPFLNAAIGRLVPSEQPDRLAPLVRATNLGALDQRLFRAVLAGARQGKSSQAAFDAHQKRLADRFEED